ncbi:jg5248, partial [Pararge aegeria aegeria]
WVMHKYRQLHLDSNHGFVRLSDDPVPTENAIKTTNVPKPASSNFNSSKRDLSLPKANLDRPQTEIRYFSATALPNPNTCIAQNTSDSFTTSTSKLQNAPTVAPGPSRSPPQQASSTPNNSNASRSETNGSMSGVANPGRLAPAPMTDWANLSEQKNAPKTNAATHDRNTNSISSIGPCTLDSSGIADGLGSVSQNGAVPRAKRSNHQPQVNTASAAVPDKVNKNL